MSVITRFAPSPTGYLHIGGARTALFNYLFALHHQGKFLLRIEDTDQARSTSSATAAIIDGLKWLEINWHEEIVMQSARQKRHQEVAHELVLANKAYYCYMSLEELAAQRATKTRINSIYRDMPKEEHPKDLKPVVRLKAPLTGDTVINDLVQGRVSFSNQQADDMILLRADGSPTYMLAVVVDDHDMGVTHIIRGDDHLNNAQRQTHIYEALNWNIPHFAHIPLIHGEDGAKLSKRHGALGVEEYRDMGYLPQALCNYLLRLGWSHGNDEIISINQAIEWFDLGAVNKAAARLDFKKLASVNAHYLKSKSDEELLELLLPYLSTTPDELTKLRLSKALKGLKPRANTLVELANNAKIYSTNFKVAFSEQATALLEKFKPLEIILELLPLLENVQDWQEHDLCEHLRSYAERKGYKFSDLSQILRVLLTGSTISPSVFEIMWVLGKEESLARLKCN
jgi:glutamyl-tRNA synthetase